METTTFFLKTKSGEIINSKNLPSLEEAIKYFAQVKKLSEIDLLKIYDVK